MCLTFRQEEIFIEIIWIKKKSVIPKYILKTDQIKIVLAIVVIHTLLFQIIFPGDSPDGPELRPHSKIAES